MDSQSERAAKHLAWDIETRSSVEMRVRTEITPHRADPQHPSHYNVIDEHYIETAAGQRFCESRSLKSGELVRRSVHYGDGSKFADVDYEENNPDLQRTIVVKRSYYNEDKGERREVPQPLLYLYVGRKPLHEALSVAENLGTDRVMGRECDVFLFPQVRWNIPQDHVYYLDRATSVPLKVESFRDESGRVRKEPLWVWIAESLEEVEGHFVPLTSKQISYSADRTPAFTRTYHVQSIEFNRDYPPSMFWPTPQPGVTVFDAIADTIYEVPGTNEIAAAAKVDAAATSRPIEAAPPVGLATAAPGVMLGLGLSITLAAFLLWRRQR